MPENTVSVIITILNGEKWIDRCFASILQQTAVLKQQQTHAANSLMSYVTSASTKAAARTALSVEVCVFDDCSSDGTADMLNAWKRKFHTQRMRMCIIRNAVGKAKGVGYGRNRAIAVATGAYLCFLDVDDEMLPSRIQKQYALAKRHKDAIIGSKFIRTPANSTCRFSRWANELNSRKLALQIYTANGPTVIMPTWFCHRSVYARVPGGFCEDGHGTPEDLIFFYAHLDRGGCVLRVDECLLLYRYHPEATTFSIAAETIWRLRMQHLIANVLSSAPWNAGFTIWNAGKQGRKFFRDLPAAEQKKVLAFCDVDKKKIHKSYARFDEKTRKITHSIPIVHFTEARPPLLICMKLDLTNGALKPIYVA